MPSPSAEELAERSLDRRPAPVRVHPGTRPVAHGDDPEAQRSGPVAHLVPRLHASPGDNAAEHPFLRHDTGPDLAENGTLRAVALFPHLGHLQTRLADVQGVEDADVGEAYARGGDVLGEFAGGDRATVTFAERLDQLQGQKTDLPVPGPRMGIAQHASPVDGDGRHALLDRALVLREVD